MKKALLLFVAIVASYSMSAQNDTIRYKIIKDDPMDIPKYSFNLAPIAGEYNVNGGPVAGYEIGARTIIKDLVKVEGSYRGAYYSHALNGAESALHNNAVHPKDETITVTNEYSLPQQFEIGIGFVLSDKVATYDRMVPLFQQQTGNLILTTLTKIPTQFRRRISARVGYYQTKSIIDLTQSGPIETESGTILHSDGIEYAGVDYTTIDDGEVEFTNFNKAKTFGDGIGDGSHGSDWYAQTQTNVFYIGIESEKIVNQVYETDKYGKAALQGGGRFYFDVLFGTPSVEDILFYGSNTGEIKDKGDEVSTNIVAYTPVIDEQNVGARIGYESFGVSRSHARKFGVEDPTAGLFNLGFKFEGGLRPGYNTNFYVSMAIYLTLNR